MRRPRLLRRPRVIQPLGLRLQWGGGAIQTKKLRRLGRTAKLKESWKSDKRATPIHWEEAPNVFEIHWAKHYPNCERYK